MFSKRLNEEEMRNLFGMANKMLAIASAMICVLVSLSCAPAPIAFRGDDLGATPAPNFSLTTPDGQAAALSDWRGHLVVLTFVYTQCTDICPLIAHKLSEVYTA